MSSPPEEGQTAPLASHAACTAQAATPNGPTSSSSPTKPFGRSPAQSILRDSPAEFHDARCVACGPYPIWGQRYACVACPNSSFCARCAARLPHDASYMFVLVPGQFVRTTALAARVAADVARALSARGELRDCLSHLAAFNVAAHEPPDELAVVRDPSEKGLYGRTGHPFRRAIPPPLFLLSDDAPLNENVAALVQACPPLRVLALDAKGDPLMPKTSMRLSRLVKLWANFAARHAPALHLLSVGESLLASLEKPVLSAPLPRMKRKLLSLLPGFLLTDDNTADHPYHHGVRLLFCIWILNASSKPKGQAFCPLDEADIRNFIAVSGDYERITARACSIAMLDCMYCIPLAEMKKRRIPCRLQESSLTRATQYSSNEHIQSTSTRVTIFVSHAWRTSQHPDPQGEDWQKVQEFIWAAIASVVDAITVLILNGADRVVLKEYLMHCEADEKPKGLSHPFGGLVTPHLFRDILRCAMGEMPSERTFPVDSRRDWCRNIASHVQVWFDFSSLPQSPRTGEETALFRKTLAQLSDLQSHMHTMAVSPEFGYMRRAWCVAEWLLANSVSSPFSRTGSGDLHSQILPLGLERMRLAGDALHALLDPDLSNTELSSLGLTITNGKLDSEIVCKVLWESARKATTRFSLRDSPREQLIIASGTLRGVASAIDSLREDGFTRELFDLLPAVSARQENLPRERCGERTLSVFWLMHALQKGEDEHKSLKRDLAGLHAALLAISNASSLRAADLTMRVGFTFSTVVKRSGALLCGFSCDEHVCDIADIVIPMRGSAEELAITVDVPCFKLSLDHWLNDERQSVDHVDAGSAGGTASDTSEEST